MTAAPSPTVSIVIDNYNYARYLDRAVRSALSQTYPVEIVVVDDGSTDESLDVLASYAAEITVVAKPNGGQASALNAGVAASAGDVVMFLDADDVLAHEAAARVAEVVVPDVAKVHFRLGAIGEDDRDLGFTNPPMDRPLADGDVIPDLLARGRYDTPVMSGNAYARWALDRVVPIPESAFRISADGYLAATVPFHGRVRAIDAVLGGYRIHGGNAWAQDALRPDRLNGFVAHDLARHEALEAEARRTEAGRAAPLERNPAHLRARVASWRLGRAGHPIAGDSRWSLIRAGVPAQLRAPLPAVKRLLYAVWYLVVAAAPTPLARWAAVQFYLPQRRARVTGAVSRAASRPPTS